ncbi:WD40 repeat-like protein [Stemphylium lycopersici]|uniref:WD40 repeat-like protein n=1 Tax=Stemphylium lycopersici TaxID=183478 RepID=A0A364MZQ2_STELY|nr:wd repeat-containing protein [Stemphylium lycopersici]RAQ99619.1 WD40 repeat-like protein [Stemphylium lycopersici]RAR07578.1 WD40 repeat-like protein [Stemphylium lycopersici]
MDDTPSASPKRRREDENGYDEGPPRKRSASHTPPNASPSYRLAERPARRYSREETEDDTREFRERRRSYSPSRSHSPRSSSSSPSRRRRNSPPPKPTTLDYAPTLSLHGHRRGITCIKFSPDGRWLASASADCTIKIWDARTGQLEHSLEGHLAGINTICWSLDSTILASGSDDKSIRLWDTTTGMAHPTPFIGHHNYVYSIAFSPKGNMLVSGSYDEAVYLWDVRAARVMRSLPAHSDPVGGVDFVRDGTLIVSCSHDGLIRVWDTATGQCLRTLVHEDNASVSSVIFSPNGKYILAWTLDSCMRLWNYIEGKGKCVKTYQGHTNKKYSLSGTFGTYGDERAGQEFAFIASGSEDNKVVIWDVSSKNVLQRLEGHTDAVLSVHTHPTERLIASAGLDRTIRLWRPKENVPEAEEEKETNGHKEPVLENGVKEELTNGHGLNALPPNPFVES